jgi:hypothetical protein
MSMLKKNGPLNHAQQFSQPGPLAGYHGKTSPWARVNRGSPRAQADNIKPGASATATATANTHGILNQGCHNQQPILNQERR